MLLFDKHNSQNSIAHKIHLLIFSKRLILWLLAVQSKRLVMTLNYFRHLITVTARNPASWYVLIENVRLFLILVFGSIDIWIFFFLLIIIEPVLVNLINVTVDLGWFLFNWELLLCLFVDICRHFNILFINLLILLIHFYIQI